jgi:glycosyltransferase involved in cell wall biosynthesis
VLNQTQAADEIIVMNDGSTDKTARILGCYQPRVTVLSQANAGVSTARNAMIAKSRGDLIAFVDSDDIWHPQYLEIQLRLFRRFPYASAIFTKHVDFWGLGTCAGDISGFAMPVRNEQVPVEVFEPLSFFRKCRKATGAFGMSWLCVPRRVFDAIGSEPFKLRAAEDIYFYNLLPFYGPVVLASSPPLAGYRIRNGSLASDRLTCLEAEVTAFELLEPWYTKKAKGRLLAEFRKAFASKRRGFAKVLLGTSNRSEARRQLLASFLDTYNVASLAKSLALLSMSYLPGSLQPAWPPVERQWKKEAAHG